MANGQNVVITTYPPTWNFTQLMFANIQLAVEGVYFNGFNEIEYTWSVDVEEGRGVSPYAMGTTTGQYKASGSISVQLAQRETFMNIIASRSPDGNSISDALFNVQAQWQNRASQGQIQPPVFTDELFGCRIIGGGVTTSSGPSVVHVKYPLSVMLIRENSRIGIAGLAI